MFDREMFDREMFGDRVDALERATSEGCEAADSHVEERRFSAALAIEMIAGFSPRFRCAKEG